MSPAETQRHIFRVALGASVHGASISWLALLTLQMVEMAATKFVCIVDDTKLVKGLGGSKRAPACTSTSCA